MVLKIIKAKKQRVGLNRIHLGKIVFIMGEICSSSASSCCSVSLLHKVRKCHFFHFIEEELKHYMEKLLGSISITLEY